MLDKTSPSLPRGMRYENQLAMIEGMSLADIAREYPTPFYCYSQSAIEQKMQACLKAFEPTGAKVHFAVKANSNINLLRLMAKAGLGADIVSGGELTRACTAGIAPADVIFSGVAKTDNELEYAMHKGVGQYNVESIEELHRINTIAQRLGVVIDAVLRVNPEVDAGTHQHITTAKKGSKFGIAYSQLDSALQTAATLSSINVRGLAMHIGSQITSLEPYRQSIQRMLHWLEQLQAKGFAIDRIDLGGGLGVDYGNGEYLEYSDYAELIQASFANYQVDIQLELGRSLIAEAGILVSSVVSTKQSSPNNFVLLDAGMNDLLRPSLYQAHHPLLAASLSTSARPETFDVVGPICESTDCFHKNYPMLRPNTGDLMFFTVVGAYCAVLSSSYNSRTLIPELLVNGENVRVIRKAWTIDEQLKLEE